MSQPEVTPGAAGLQRRIGVWPAAGIVIGAAIGSGIFRTPASIADRVPDPPLMLAVWLLGGLISLCGALSVAELAASLPVSGGWYVFLREGWGRLAGFLFGWAELVLIRASATGAIATVFAEYLLRSLGIDGESITTSFVAAIAIVLVGVANIRGVHIGAAIAGLSTIAKCGGLAALILLAFVLGSGRGASASHFAASTMPVSGAAFGLALISVLWAYDGFADVSFAGGEISRPQRTLPRAIILGTVAISAIYMLANVAYLYVNTIDTIAGSRLIAADTMSTLVGDIGVAIVSVLVAVSTLGALTTTMLGPPRVFFAMADDRLFFRAVARVHPRYHTPHVAIMVAVALGVAFVLTRTFEQLADTFVLTIWPFYGLAIAGLYRLRRRADLPRPYSVPGYPLVPAIFVAAVIYLVANAMLSDPLWTSVTFAIVLAGIPVYYALFANRSSIGDL